MAGERGKEEGIANNCNKPFSAEMRRGGVGHLDVGVNVSQCSYCSWINSKNSYLYPLPPQLPHKGLRQS